MPTGAGLRPGAKAPEEPPDPTGGAPALDPTDERRLETEPRRGVRHRHRRKPPGTATPSAYRHRASRRLYPPSRKQPEPERAASRQVLDFIRGYVRDNGVAPSRPEDRRGARI